MKTVSDSCQIYFILTACLYTIVFSNKSIRINYGGNVLNLTEAPWTVAMAIQKNLSYLVFCTGSVIDTNWVLTAAHCILNFRKDPHELKVVAGGENSLDFAYDEFVQVRSAMRVHHHPDYRPAIEGTTDIALVYVDALEFTDRIAPVKLWDDEWPGPQALLKCKTFGWGLVANENDQEHKNIPTNLPRETYVNVQHGRCKCFKKRIAQRRLLCSHRTSEGGVCSGDSGGPLVCNNKLAGVTYAVLDSDCRLLVFGQKPPCNAPDTISAWIYVCPILGFIRHHIPSAPAHPQSCRGTQLITNFAIFWFLGLVNMVVPIY